MPRRLPVATKRFVSSRSSSDGDGSPDGWLWQLCVQDRYVPVPRPSAESSTLSADGGHITRPTSDGLSRRRRAEGRLSPLAILLDGFRLM